MKYQTLWNMTLDQGGATIRIADYPDAIIIPKVGYAVANGSQGIQLLVPRPEFRNDPDFTEAFDNVVDKALVYFPKIGAKFLGTWIDDHKMFIEPVRVIKTKDYATGLADGLGEKAVYDLAAGKSIFLKT